jgi:hypothetical protein
MSVIERIQQIQMARSKQEARDVATKKFDQEQRRVDQEKARKLHDEQVKIALKESTVLDCLLKINNEVLNKGRVVGLDNGNGVELKWNAKWNSYSYIKAEVDLKTRQLKIEGNDLKRLP